MQKIILFLFSLVLVIALAACSVGQSAVTSGAVTGSGADQSAITQPIQADVESATVSTPAPSAAEALAENQPANDSAEDYAYDAAAAVPITLNGDSITTAGAGVTVSGSTLTITSAGVYSLTGSLADGQVIVDVAGDGTIWLILAGVNIHSASSAPVYIAQAEKVVIVLADQSENILSDGDSYTFAVPEEEEPNAAFFSKADLTIAGSGSLTVTANYQDGITSKDGLVIAGGQVTVNAVDDGIRGKDYLMVKAGSLKVTAGGDGLKADNEEEADRGYISIEGGGIQVTSGGDALNAQTDVLITGGTFALTSGSGSGSFASGDVSAKGIKGTVSVNIDGGTFTIDAGDDGIHSNGGITINGGTFTIASADDGVHADESLVIGGGEINITTSYEGLESAVITLNDGSIRIVSSDDGINVAGGIDGSGMGQGRGKGGPGQDAFAASGTYHLSINGGYLYVDANGDGLDSNGSITMTGGVVLVNGPTMQNNGPLDHNGFELTGGVLVAAGSSGMAQGANTSIGQGSVLVFLDQTQPAGTLFSIQNEAGETILTFSPTKDYQSVVFSSPDLVDGKTYTVYTGGSATGASADGFYQDGTYTPGAQAASFTLSGGLATVGTGARMGGPGGGGRRPKARGGNSRIDLES